MSCMNTKNEVFVQTVNNRKIISLIMEKIILDPKFSNAELQQNAIFLINSWAKEYTFIKGKVSEFHKSFEKIKKLKLKIPTNYIDPHIYTKKFEKPVVKSTKNTSELSREIIIKICKRLDFWVRDKNEYGTIENEAKIMQKKVAEEILAGKTSQEKNLPYFASVFKEIPNLMSKICKDDMKAKLKLMEIYNTLLGNKNQINNSGKTSPRALIPEVIPAPVKTKISNPSSRKNSEHNSSIMTPTSHQLAKESAKVTQKILADNESPQAEEIKSDKTNKNNGIAHGIELKKIEEKPKNTNNEWFMDAPKNDDIWGANNNKKDNLFENSIKKTKIDDPIVEKTQKLPEKPTNNENTENLEEIENLENELKNLVLESESIEKAKSQLEEDNIQLKKDYTDLNNDYMKNTEIYNNEISELKNLLQTKKLEYEEKKSSFENVNQIQEELIQNKSSYKNLTEILNKMQEEVRKITEENSSLDSEIKNLNTLEFELNQKMKEIEAKLAEKPTPLPQIVENEPEIPISPIKKPNVIENPTLISSGSDNLKENSIFTVENPVVQVNKNISSEEYHTPPQTSPDQNVAASPPTTTEFRVSPDTAQKMFSPDGQSEILYKNCLISTNSIWHEDSTILVKISRTVNVPMKSAAYKISFENKLTDSSILIKKFDLLAFDSKGIFYDY